MRLGSRRPSWSRTRPTRPISRSRRWSARPAPTRPGEARSWSRPRPATTMSRCSSAAGSAIIAPATKSGANCSSPRISARALNRDVLVPRPAGRFLFGRLIDRDRRTPPIAPLGRRRPPAGRRQPAVDRDGGADGTGIVTLMSALGGKRTSLSSPARAGRTLWEIRVQCSSWMRGARETDREHSQVARRLLWLVQDSRDDLRLALLVSDDTNRNSPADGGHDEIEENVLCHGTCRRAHDRRFTGGREALFPA